MKVCAVCDQAKPPTEFHRHKGHKDGLTSACKPCAKARTARWLRDNPERHRAAVRRRYHENIVVAREKARIAQARRRARLRLQRAPVFNDPCVYCGDDAATFDHIEPIAHGGADHSDNLAPACLSCNQEKGDKKLIFFLLDTLDPIPA